MKIINYLKEFWYYVITPEHVIYQEAMQEAFTECVQRYKEKNETE
jgi:hypothetical protein